MFPLILHTKLPRFNTGCGAWREGTWKCKLKLPDEKTLIGFFPQMVDCCIPGFGSILYTCVYDFHSFQFQFLFMTQRLSLQRLQCLHQQSINWISVLSLLLVLTSHHSTPSTPWNILFHRSPPGTGTYRISSFTLLIKSKFTC